MDDKRCPKCGATKNQSEFYKDRSRKDGLCCWCKSCQREYGWSAKGKESDRKYQQSVKGKESREKFNQSAKGKEVQSKGQKKYRQFNPEKTKARHTVAYALKTGRLIKKPCYCGETKVEAHHDDYSKPLDVEWLCNKHHK